MPATDHSGVLTFISAEDLLTRPVWTPALVRQHLMNGDRWLYQLLSSTRPKPVPLFNIEDVEATESSFIERSESREVQDVIANAEAIEILSRSYGLEGQWKAIDSGEVLDSGPFVDLFDQFCGLRSSPDFHMLKLMAQRYGCVVPNQEGFRLQHEAWFEGSEIRFNDTTIWVDVNEPSMEEVFDIKRT